MKKVICFLLSTILIFALVGCNSSDEDNGYINEDGKLTDTSSQEEIVNKEETVKETTKKLIEFAPTYKEHLQKLIDKGIMTGSTKADFIKYKGTRNCVSLTYKESGYNAYMIYLFYDSNEKVIGVSGRTIGDYYLTDEPFSAYLEYFPNSLSAESSVIEYVKSNGRSDGDKMCLTENGIEYSYSIEYNNSLGSYTCDFTVEIDPNYEVKD